MRHLSAPAVLSRLSVLLVLAGAAHAGKVAPRPLDERLALADAVVVGRLASVKARAESEPYIVDGKKKADRWFDLGTLRVSAVLKGPKTLKKTLKVLLDSPGQAEIPWPSHPAGHEAGEEGVWLLSFEEGATRYSLLGPERNPLPLSARDEAVESLEKKEKR